MSSSDELQRRANEYAQENELVLGRSLGFGVHGSVFITESQGGSSLRVAIKLHRRETEYARERDVYLRLQARGVKTIRGCDVPQMLHFDDQRWIIAMTVVKRPFVLDFAGAYLDRAPDFSEEVMADWHAEKKEQFGARWGEAQAILRALETYGVFMIDVNPGNIAFADPA
jgi:hypothetical protein